MHVLAKRRTTLNRSPLRINHLCDITMTLNYWLMNNWSRRFLFTLFGFWFCRHWPERDEFTNVSLITSLRRQCLRGWVRFHLDFRLFFSTIFKSNVRFSFLPSGRLFWAFPGENNDIQIVFFVVALETFIFSYLL